MTEQETVKVISMIEPAAIGLRASERYYRDVHIPLIRRTLMVDPQWLTYMQDRLVRQYDADGGFRKQPDRWRLVQLRCLPADPAVNLDDPTAVSRPNPPALERVIELDHPNFLGGLRRFEAREVTLFSTSTVPTALVKYVIFVEEGAGGAEEARDHYLSFTQALLAASPVRPEGIRRLVRNDIIAETETELKGMALVPSRRRLPTTPMQGILEVWFDHRFAGAEFFSNPKVREMVHFGKLRVTPYSAQETCGFDKR